MTPIPHGVVTFLFSDVEGSTRLLETHPGEIGRALARHHELLATAIRANSGVIFETVGDAVYAAFQHAPDAARAALAGQRSLKDHDWGPIPRLRVRMALHTGEVESRGAHYFGAPLFRCARLQSLAYGEQTVLSEASAALIRAAVPPDATLRDLGWQRLKDLDEPEHVYQLDADGLPSEFPPLRSIGETKHNLPAEFSSFVGREENLNRLRKHIAEPGVVAIVGPGGVGKTRLATHLAREALEDFPDGVCLVELGPLSLASQCVPATALALRLRETPGRSIQEVVKSYLADKRMLVILDNAEHLADIRVPIRELVAAAPNASFVVTSRTRLAIPGAQHEHLDPMRVEPRAAEEPAAPAVALLADRVRSLDQSFQLTSENTAVVAQICTRVDGLPLGLELVAPAVASLGVRETLASLSREQGPTLAEDDAGDRHASLRATVAWSYGLLDAGARSVFAQLSVFVGSFDIAAARSVCRLQPEETDRGLLALIGSSLLSPAEGVASERRFSLLVTVRDFALGLVPADEAAVIEARHATHFAQLASEAAEQLRGPEQGFWRSRLTQELPNLRAALAWTERNSPDRVLQFTLDLERFWDSAGLNAEGRAWLEGSLARYHGPLILKARAIRWLGRLSEAQGDLTSAARAYQQASALQLEMGDTSGLVETQRTMAGMLAHRGRLGKARLLLEDAIAAARQHGDPRLTADALHGLTLFELESGDSTLAIGLSLELEELFERVGDPEGVAVAKHHYGRALRQTGRLQEAELASKAAVAMFEGAGSDGWLAPPLVNLAWIQLAVSDTQSARKHLCRALLLVHRMEDWQLLPRVLEGLAAVSAVDGNNEHAHRIIRAADATRRRSHWPRNRSDSRELRRYVKPAPKSARGPDATVSEVDELLHELLEDCRG